MSKTAFMLPVLFVAAMLTAADAPAPAAMKADPVHSCVLFRIRHMGASWTWGRFNEISADLSVDEAKPEASSVSFTVKAESVDTGNAKRDQHLKGPDFLNARQFPDIAFRSTQVKAAGKDACDVTGDLTLHGVTKSVTVRVVKVGQGKGMKGGELFGYETAFAVKRSDYGMTNMVGPVGDEVQLTVEIECGKP